MAWTWRAQAVKRLSQREGILGKIASLYIAAGYGVKFRYKTSRGTIDLLAIKGNTKLAINVITSSKELNTDVIRKVFEVAEDIGGKPILIIYGRTRVSEDIVKEAKKLNVKVKRVRIWRQPQPH